MKPVTSEAHMAFCSSLDPTGGSCFCRGDFQKYWSIVYFYHPIPPYHSGPTSLSFGELKMKEDLHVSCQGIGYEEGFGLSEVFFFQHKKRRIDNHVIINSFEYSDRQ